MTQNISIFAATKLIRQRRIQNNHVSTKIIGKISIDKLKIQIKGIVEEKIRQHFHLTFFDYPQVKKPTTILFPQVFQLYNSHIIKLTNALHNLLPLIRVSSIGDRPFFTFFRSIMFLKNNVVNNSITIERLIRGPVFSVVGWN
jgi:hypothetical protein